jgi:hypothetical protein
MVAWSPPRRLAFRFATPFAVLLLLPFPLGVIPGTGWIAELLHVPWDVGVAWFARTRLFYGALTREPDPLLVTRGFHWIQERPFHR